jgi:hypothetical protein
MSTTVEAAKRLTKAMSGITGYIVPKTYDPDAVPVLNALQTVGLRNIFSVRKPYDPEGKLAAATTAHKRAVDLRDQGLPPSLKGPKQGTEPNF